MFRMISRRLVICVVQMFLVSLLVLILSELMPGDALTGQVSPHLTGERLAEMRRLRGLDQPWLARYVKWLAGIARGDFGTSFTHRIPVARLVGEKFGNTLMLGVFSFLFCFGIAIPLGIIAGRRRGRLPDKFISAGGYALMSTPQAVFGILAIFLFSYRLSLFPFGGSVSSGASGFFASAASRLHHVFLPSLTSAMFSIPIVMQLVRAEITVNQDAEYVDSLRSRGVAESRIFRIHVLRNSLIPVAALAGALIAALLSGTVLVETIFSYPGIGKLFVDSILQRDYPVVNFLILLSALIAVTGTLLSDIVMNGLDQRIKMR